MLSGPAKQLLAHMRARFPMGDYSRGFRRHTVRLVAWNIWTRHNTATGHLELKDRAPGWVARVGSLDDGGRAEKRAEMSEREELARLGWAT